MVQDISNSYNVTYINMRRELMRNVASFPGGSPGFSMTRLFVKAGYLVSRDGKNFFFLFVFYLFIFTMSACWSVRYR